MKVQKRAQLTGHTAAVFALAEGSGRGDFFSGAGEGWLVHWHLDAPDTGKLVAKVDNQVFAMLHLAEQGMLLAGTMHGGLHWIDLEHPEATRNVAHHQRGVFDLIQVDQFVYSAGGEGVLTRWSIDEKRTVESIQLSNRSLRSLSYAPGINEIAVGASDGHIYILDASSLVIKHVVTKAHEPSVFCVRFSPDEQGLYSGGRDAHLRIWNPHDNYACLSEFPAHWYTLNSICFHPKGHLFATASRDRTIKIWDRADGQLLKVLDTIRHRCHINSVNKLLWLSGDEVLVSVSDDRSIILWDLH
jgi:WD40 repeat protein